MKILAIQFKPDLGNFKANIKRILSYCLNNQDADICVFPECATTGYLPYDLTLKPSFLQDLKTEIEHFIAKTKDLPQLIVLPTILPQDGIYNACLVIKNGKIIHTIIKQKLPNYGVFDENRFFKTKPNFSSVFEYRGRKIAVFICEDIWHLEIYKDIKADLVIIVNASPFEIGKFQTRTEIVRKVYQILQAPLLYLNQVLSIDGLVFDGRSFIYNHEGLKILANKLDEEAITFNLDEPQPYLPNPTYEDEIYSVMVFGLREYLLKNGFSKVVLGLSGGIDSALVALIAADAIGSSNVYSLMLPFEYTSVESLEDAYQIAQNLQINHNSLAIHNIFDTFTAEIQQICNLNSNNLITQNLQARIRGTILMSYATSLNALLITTGNKSEIATGYCTLYGDMCGGFNPIKDIYKTDVFRLVKWRNQNNPTFANTQNFCINPIPKRVIERAPSAELAPNQKDSDNLPEYHLLDQILYKYIEEDLGLDDIISQGFDASDVIRTINLVRQSEFKRKQGAYGVKISKRDFDRGRRYPIGL